ncbi:hypothetical protein [Sinorhizobium meliloti]|uniref:hypothetical protein n=1 Tax=Rhizobium meliloti TaxID=382 RepID=UPI000FDC0083|nr:hypothetical protein [Sinorhizobium meliloti]RVL37962.1 hypothetical protein CN148_11605 [Sinorhizobium meliloti]
MDWQEMESAPLDGTQILVARDNGCGFEYYTVWWSRHDKDYPWQSDHNAHAVDRFDYWSPIKEPTN